jgi:hypothetical protein
LRISQLAPLAVTGAVGAVAAVSLSHAIESGTRDEANRATRTRGPGISIGDGKPVGGSLYEPAGFRRALDRVRKEAGPEGRVWFLRLAADSLSVQAKTGRSGRSITLFSDGRIQSVDLPVSPSGAFSFRAVDTSVPRRLVAGVRERTGDSVDYLVLSRFADRLQWGAYLDQGARFFQADEHGRGLAPGGGGTITRTTRYRIKTTGPVSRERLERLNACVQRAGGDVARIQACTRRYL